MLSVFLGKQAAVLNGLPELTVGALPAEAAAELLAARVGRPVDPQVGALIVAEAAGNPLALMEFAGELTGGQISGAVPLHGPLRCGGELEELYMSRVRGLPEQAQLLLLVAAADELGGPVKVWRAAGQLDIDAQVAGLPEVDRLVSWAPRIRFRHPLMRSAAYYSAAAPARRRAHEALAAVSDPQTDPDRRAWHLAAAAPGPDEEVAAQLEASAGRARARGGWASSAAFLERAAELTPDAGRRAQRLLEAAGARLDAGEARAARTLLDRAEPQLADPLGTAKARRLEGLTLYALEDRPAASSALLEAAGMIAPHDPRLARDTLLEALLAAQFSGQFGVAALRASRGGPPVTRAAGTNNPLRRWGVAAKAHRR